MSYALDHEAARYHLEQYKQGKGLRKVRVGRKPWIFVRKARIPNQFSKSHLKRLIIAASL